MFFLIVFLAAWAGSLWLSPAGPAPDDRPQLRVSDARTPGEPLASVGGPAVPQRRRGVRAALVGVVLTGTLDDGASGLGAIRRCGGIAVVQNPDDAACAEMPRSAAEHVEVDYSVPLSQMGELPGRPRDEQGAIRASPRRPIEREAPPIMDRAPVTTPRQTGRQVIDALGSAERWHARPRCVDGTGAGSKGFMGCN